MDKDMAYVSVKDGEGPSAEDRCSGMAILGGVFLYPDFAA
jgi:hypothetical protein